MSDRQSLIESMSWEYEGAHYISTIKGVKTSVLPEGDPAKYTDEELGVLASFAKLHTDYYNSFFGGPFDYATNFILIDKDITENRTGWFRKRTSWRQGPYWSASLPEAIAIFCKWSSLFKSKPWVLLKDGTYGFISGRYDGEFKAPEYYSHVVSLSDSSTVNIGERDPVILAASEEELRRYVRMALLHRCQTVTNRDRQEYYEALADNFDIQAEWQNKPTVWCDQYQ